MRNDEYYNRCNGIYHLLVKAYMDREMLRAMGIHNHAVSDGNIVLGKNSHYVLEHICELAKADLALCVYKMYVDNDAKANTLQHLRNCYRDTCGACSVKVKISKKYDGLSNEIRTIRNQLLAHDDWDKRIAPFDLTNVFDALDEMKNIYNALCNTEIDDRVCRLENVGAIGLNTVMGLLPMIQGGATKTTERGEL